MTNDAATGVDEHSSPYISGYYSHQALPAHRPGPALYTKADVDVFVGEALRRVVWTFGHWNLEHCIDHVRQVADDLGVEIPDE